MTRMMMMITTQTNKVYYFVVSQQKLFTVKKRVQAYILRNSHPSPYVASYIAVTQSLGRPKNKNTSLEPFNG